jgi:hypothetical protein
MQRADWLSWPPESSICCHISQHKCLRTMGWMESAIHRGAPGGTPASRVLTNPRAVFGGRNATRWIIGSPKDTACTPMREVISIAEKFIIASGHYETQNAIFARIRSHRRREYRFRQFRRSVTFPDASMF